MSACLKELNKTPSSSATMCIHLSIFISCKSFSKAVPLEHESASNSAQIEAKSIERIQVKQKQNQLKFNKAFDWTKHSMKSVLNIDWSRIQQRWHALNHIISRVFSRFSLLTCFENFLLLQLVFSFQFFLLWLFCCAMIFKQRRWWWMKTRKKIVSQ